jgi:hypothetical protein
LPFLNRGNGKRGNAPVGFVKKYSERRDKGDVSFSSWKPGTRKMCAIFSVVALSVFGNF